MPEPNAMFGRYYRMLKSYSDMEDEELEITEPERDDGTDHELPVDAHEERW